MPRIAYLVNQYPKVSHSFIRREIQALEQHGAVVSRFALRGWADELVDAGDEDERQETRYVLQRGVLSLLVGIFVVFGRSPLRFVGAVRSMLSLGWRADRSLLFHLIYLAEACCIKRWCDELCIDHAHAHFGTNPAEVLLLCHRLGGPTFSFTVHGPEEFDRPLALKLREKVEAAAFVVAVSSFGKSQLSRWVPHEQWSKIKVVHCGLDPSFLDAPLTPVPDVPRFVCVGRLCEQKGQLLLVEAACRLKESGVDFELVLAGDGEMRLEIERLIVRYGLESQVSITGWVSSDRVADLLASCRALVLPSFAEGLPVVIMEAMAIGRPVVSTYIAGIPELINSKDIGWLVPAGSIDQLAEAMCDVAAATSDGLSMMAKQAKVRVINRHSAAVEAGKLLSEVNALTNANPRGLDEILGAP